MEAAYVVASDVGRTIAQLICVLWSLAKHNVEQEVSKVAKEYFSGER